MYQSYAINSAPPTRTSTAVMSNPGNNGPHGAACGSQLQDILSSSDRRCWNACWSCKDAFGRACSNDAPCQPFQVGELLRPCAFSHCNSASFPYCRRRTSCLSDASCAAVLTAQHLSGCLHQRVSCPWRGLRSEAAEASTAKNPMPTIVTKVAKYLTEWFIFDSKSMFKFFPDLSAEKHTQRGRHQAQTIYVV